jgi:hypothetical protein
MAVRVINPLQTVEINVHHPRHGRAVATSMLDDSLHLAHETTAVGEWCQRVGIDQPFQLLDPIAHLRKCGTK